MSFSPSPLRGGNLNTCRVSGNPDWEVRTLSRALTHADGRNPATRVITIASQCPHRQAAGIGRWRWASNAGTEMWVVSVLMESVARPDVCTLINSTLSTPVLQASCQPASVAYRGRDPGGWGCGLLGSSCHSTWQNSDLFVKSSDFKMMTLRKNANI